MAYAKLKNTYAKNELESQVNERSSHQLVALLFDEAYVLSHRMLALYKGHPNGPFLEASNKFIRIVLGLRTVLDMEQGGEVAEALFESYSAIASCAFKQIRNPNESDLQKISLAMQEIRTAWKECGSGS